MELTNMDIKKLSKLIKNKAISPVDLTKALLNRIKKYNHDYNAYITINEEQAIKDAIHEEENIINGFYKGDLQGIPISIKDNINVKNTKITNGSIVNPNEVSLKEASLINELRNQGAILIGKTNMDEFANNITGDNKNYGVIRNPINKQYTAGGSSGGSAVSVAKTLAYGSVGTDTSGSVRIPASCCGIFGLKPTYGLLPIDGITPLSHSLDHAGILAKNIDDLSILFHALLPGDTKNTKSNIKPIHKLKVGILVDYDTENNSEVQKDKNDVIQIFKDNGTEIIELETGFLKKFMDTHLTICSTEAATYHKQYLTNYSELYDKQNLDFFENGNKVSQMHYVDALRTKDVIGKQFKDIFFNVDIIITPTLPVLPPSLESFKDNWEENLNQLIKYTGPINMAGLPALSIPFSDSVQGLPIGIQLITDKYNEELLLSIGKWLIDNNDKKTSSFNINKC